MFLQDANFGPEPPTGLQVLSETSEYVFTGVVAAVGLVAIGYAAHLSRRSPSWIPILCCAGGFLAVFTEPLIDSHLQVWWPKHHQPDVLSVWGRNIPVVGMLAIMWYFGAGTYLRWTWLRRKGAAANIWLLFSIEVGVALILEPLAIKYRIWYYYGEHGLSVFGYPVFWPFIAAACGATAGTILYKLAPYLTGWRVLVTVPLIPSTISAIYWFCGWPMYTVLNVQAPLPVLYLCNLASIGLALLVVWMCTIAAGGYQLGRQKRDLKTATKEFASVTPEEVTR